MCDLDLYDLYILTGMGSVNLQVLYDLQGPVLHYVCLAGMGSL